LAILLLAKDQKEGPHSYLPLFLTTWLAMGQMTGSLPGNPLFRYLSIFETITRFIGMKRFILINNHAKVQ